MAMINSGTYEFKSICNLMDFVKPLILEGYPVAIDTVRGEYTIKKFVTYIGEKGVKFYCAEPTQEAPNE